MKHSEWYRSLPEMDRRTGIDPVHAADVTLHELRNFFRTELPADFEARLVQRMEPAFARHARWRNRAIQAEEPDFVRIFFRRWLAELLFKERRDLFWRLPPGYRYGEPIWPESHLPKTAPSKPLPESQRVEPVEIIRPLRKVVRQSLPFVHGVELLAV
jgi:hypothetical protein